MDPANGYVIAAYTTLVGYMVLFILHVRIVNRMNMGHVYDFRFNVLTLAGMLVLSLSINMLYGVSPFVRYAITLIYGAGLFIILFRNKERIIRILKKK